MARKPGEQDELVEGAIGNLLHRRGRCAPRLVVGGLPDLHGCEHSTVGGEATWREEATTDLGLNFGVVHDRWRHALATSSQDHSKSKANQSTVKDRTLTILDFPDSSLDVVQRHVGDGVPEVVPVHLGRRERNK